MVSTTYTVDVYYKQLEDQFRQGGPGGRWLDRVVLEMFTLAKATVPARSGDLRGAHRIFPHGVNQYLATIDIEVNTGYAEYVHEGTDGDEASGDWIYLPPGGPGVNTVSPYAGQRFGKKRLRFVAGQRSNPWLDNACQKVAGTYGAF